MNDGGLTSIYPSNLCFPGRLPSVQAHWFKDDRIGKQSGNASFIQYWPWAPFGKVFPVSSIENIARELLLDEGGFMLKHSSLCSPPHVQYILTFGEWFWTWWRPSSVIERLPQCYACFLAGTSSTFPFTECEAVQPWAVFPLILEA